MTAERRLTAIETSLGPTDLVLHILAEAKTFDGLEAYTRSIVAQPDEAAPLMRIAAGAESSVRAVMKGASRDDIHDAVRRAVGEGIFRFLLILKMNEAALEIAPIEGLRASGTFFWMRCLLGGPREKDLAPKEWAEHRKERAIGWRTWRGVVAGLVVSLTVEEDAREQLEARYLGGQSCLLADAEREWSRFGEIVDRMYSLAENLAPLTRAEKRGLPMKGEELYAERVRERARRLADDARIATFDRLGENARALRILEGRLARSPIR